MQLNRSNDLTGGAWVRLLTVLLALGVTLPAEAQPGFGRMAWRGQMIQADDAAVTDEGGDVAGSASLPMDDNVDRKLRKAQEYLEQKRYDLAITVWQEILNGSEQFMRKRDVVRTESNEYPIFDSVHAFIEAQLALLAKNSPEGMKEYRIKADADARELIAQGRGKDEERALAEVVRRYFFSSLGDDAAYALGCLMLDRHEFVAASRLFLDMVTRHPDYTGKTDMAPVAPRDEVLLRAAVASARGGDVKTAKAVLDELQKSRSTVASAEILTWLERTTSKGGGRFEGIANLPGDWPIAYGAAARDRSMPGLPADTSYRGVWHPLWVVRYNDDRFGLTSTTPQPPRPTPSPANPPEAIDPVTAAAVSKYKRDIYDSRRRELVRRWDSGDRMPADQMVLSAGRLYFRAYDRVVCVEGRTGRTLFATRPSPPPQIQPIGGMQTSQAEEVMLFADRTFSSMSVSDGVLYYLEEDQSAPLPQDRAIFQAHGISAMPPRLGNRIVAVDARSGKLLWTSANEPDKTGNRASIRYLAAPVVSGTLLLTPAVENNSLFLYARRADAQGALAWKTELAGVPTKGDSPWVTTGLAVAGGDAYLCHGGVVFNVDAAAGHVRWAVRYARAATGGMNPNYGQSILSTKGFDDDYLVPFGRGVVIAAHDCDTLFALDRRTGRLLWEMNRQNATHVIGVLGQSLYVANADTVWRYGLLSGAEEDRAELGEYRLSGRGFISNDGLYLPSKTAIFRRHPIKINNVLSTVGTSLTIRDSSGAPEYWDPVGNLYSDGKRLYSASVERVYALGDVTKLKPVGNGQAEDDEETARVPRPPTGDANVDLLQEMGIEPTAQGIGAFLKQLHPDEQTKKQVAALLDQLGDEDYDKRQTAESKLRRMAVPPIEALTAARDGTDDAEVKGACDRLLMATENRRTRLLYAAFSTVRIRAIKGLAAPVIKAAPFCAQPYLMDALSRALAVTASAEDAAVLRQAAGDASAPVRRAAAAALGATLKLQAKPDLDLLAKDDDEGVKLAAARAMANLGDRDCLDLLAALLESEAVDIRSGAGRALSALTGQSIPFVAYDKPENRRIAIDKWKAWIAASGKTASLKYPLVESKHLVGRTLICNYRMNKVVEVDADGKETWSVQVTNPWSAIGLPNGHRLVASYAGTVTEYNAAGENIWQQVGLPAPFALERLENGNTLIACANGNRIVEVAPDKTTVRTINMPGRPTSLQMLENGNLLVSLQHSNRVVEIDSGDKIVWQLDNILGAISAQRLPNGHTLVAETSGGRVREFDADKKEFTIIAQIDGQPIATPYHAQRLDNGNTLITDRFGVREVDAKGSVVWKRAEQWISRATRY